MIQLEIEWQTANLQATSEHFLTTPYARNPTGHDGTLATVQDASDFLLLKLDQAFLRSSLPSNEEDLYTDSFEIYRSVWVSVRVAERPLYAGGDRLFAGKGSMVRDHGVLQKLAAGVLANRSLNVPSAQTRVLLAEVFFLTLLGTSALQS